MAELRGERVDWESAWLVAEAADGEDSARLAIRPGIPVISLDRLGSARSGTRPYRATEIHRRGVVWRGLIRTVRR